jgi:hypothetical protein
MKPATVSPVYCAIYPELAEIARAHGYALAVHGSMASDFDLVAIPWTSDAAEPTKVLGAITEQFAFELRGECEIREHGRLGYSLTGCHGWCGHLDISFMPRVTPVDHSLCCKCACVDGGKCGTEKLCDDCWRDEGMPRIGGGK